MHAKLGICVVNNVTDKSNPNPTLGRRKVMHFREPYCALGWPPGEECWLLRKFSSKQYDGVWRTQHYNSHVKFGQCASFAGRDDIMWQCIAACRACLHYRTFMHSRTLSMLGLSQVCQYRFITAPSSGLDASALLSSPTGHWHMCIIHFSWQPVGCLNGSFVHI